MSKIVLLALLALTLLFLWFFYIQLRYAVGQKKKHKNDKQFRLAKSVIALTVLPGILTTAFAAGLTVGCIRYRQASSITADPPEPTPSAEQNGSLDVPPYHTSTPVSNKGEFSAPFQLSEVENSVMLTLADTLSCEDNITIDLLSACAKRFDSFLELNCYPPSFFPFYENLDAYFPNGEEVVYTFDDVHSLEECDAQLRGAGEKLKTCKSNNQTDQIARHAHHLAIRSGDALNYSKYHSMESPQQRESIWLYAEISFSALINEYIYGQPQGLARSDWYYRLSQVYDYLGGIADTDELKLKMYFLSGVFLRCAYEILVEQGIQIYKNAYDHEIWDLYVRMLCRVAVRVEDAEADGFFSEIYRIETTIVDQPLPANVINNTNDVLNSLEPYQKWRD